MKKSKDPDPASQPDKKSDRLTDDSIHFKIEGPQRKKLMHTGGGIESESDKYLLLWKVEEGSIETLFFVKDRYGVIIPLYYAGLLFDDERDRVDCKVEGKMFYAPEGFHFMLLDHLSLIRIIPLANKPEGSEKVSDDYGNGAQ